MSEISFLRAWPRNPATGDEVAVRLAGGGTTRAYVLDGQHYRAGLVDRPRFSAGLSFDDAGWGGTSIPTAAPLTFAPSDQALRDTLLALHWRDARIELDGGDEDGWIARVLTGVIADVGYSDGVFTFTVADLSRAYDKAILTSFAGTGGLEGYDGATGRPKRRSWGVVRNVEGRLLDPVNNIYEFGDPAQPLGAILALRDKGRAGPIALLGWQGSMAATFVSLQAAVAVQGGGVVAPSIAAAKWWTEPAGPITADLQGEVAGGGVLTVAAIASRLVTLAGGAGIDNVAAAVGWRPGVAGHHVDELNETWSASIDRLVLGASLIWRLAASGQSYLNPIDFDQPGTVLAALFEGRDRTLMPTRTRTLIYRVNHRRHGDGEISAAVPASDVAYADGTPVEALKPAQPGADVTGSNTAAAIDGQGSLATRNNVVFDTHITSLPASIDPANILPGGRLDARQVQYWGGPLIQTLQPAEAGANVTEARVAAAVVGQGGLATRNFVALGGPGSFGNGTVVDEFNNFYVTNANAVTAFGTAAAIAGQGALATRGDVAFDIHITALPAAIAPANILADGRLDARQVQYWGGPLIQTLQPAEVGANVTEVRIAAAIAGQGVGATANSLAALDPAAAATLSAAAAGGAQTVPSEALRTVQLAAGASIGVSAAIAVEAGGSTGTLGCRIEVSQTGADSWATVVQQLGDAVGPSEPGRATATGTFVNSAGTDLLFDFRAVRYSSPPGAGGDIRAARSWLRV